MKTLFLRIARFLFFALFLSRGLTYADAAHVTSQKHSGPVNGIGGARGNLYSAGNDGFVTRWAEGGEGEKFQISDLQIKLLAVHPAGEDFAVYETDGFSVHRVSVWNWKSLKRRYEKVFPNQVTALAFTKKGSYLAVGTASMVSVFFFNAATGAQVRNLSTQTGVASFIESSDTEASCVVYSPLGVLSYYTMPSGKQKAEFSCEPDLTRGTLFGDNLYFAGCKGSEIFVIYALTGKTVARIPARNPVLAASGDRLYFAEITGRNGALKYMERREDAGLSPVQTLKRFSLSEGTSFSTCFFSGSLYLGAVSGNIYAASLEGDSVVRVTSTEYQPVLDMDVLDGEDFCFLTPTSVFVSRYGPGDISAIAPNSEGYTNLTCVNGAVFLWAINTKKPVRHIDQTFASRVIYTPTSSITGLRPFDTGLIIIEGNSSVSLYSFENGGTIQVYTGTGVQDAILTKGRELIIAKTAADNPQSPLISVDAQTRETVRLSLSGEIAFSLASSEYDGSGAIYGVTVSAQGNTRRTNLFSYTPSTQSSQILLYYAGENVTAFVGLRGSTLYTNIGKATAAYNVRTRAQTQLERPAGLSKKIAGNRRYIASLGTDGGVAWYEAGRTSLLDQWYVLQDGSWEKPAPPEPPPEPPAEPPAPAQAEEAPPQENTPPDEPL